MRAQLSGETPKANTVARPEKERTPQSKAKQTPDFQILEGRRKEELWNETSAGKNNQLSTSSCLNKPTTEQQRPTRPTKVYLKFRNLKQNEHEANIDVWQEQWWKRQIFMFVVNAEEPKQYREICKSQQPNPEQQPSNKRNKCKTILTETITSEKMKIPGF